MNKRALRSIGVLLLLLGIVLLLNAFQGITGLVIAESIGKDTSSIFGLALVAIGIALLSYRELEAYDTRESQLQKILGKHHEELSPNEKKAYNKSYRRNIEKEEKREQLEIKRKQEKIKRPEQIYNSNIIRTEHFKRVIRGHDEKAIERAIKKIGTGLGKEEKLRHLSGYAIRVSKGGRIRYDKRSDGTVELLDYLPSHKYSHGYS